MSTKAERYAVHVAELAGRHGVQVVIQGRGIGYRRERRVTVPAVRGQVSYLIALHELGHVVGPNPPLRLAQEVAAWQWALDNAIEKPTPASYRAILLRLESYADRQARWASMKRPAEFDVFLDEMRNVAEPRGPLTAQHRQAKGTVEGRHSSPVDGEPDEPAPERRESIMARKPSNVAEPAAAAPAAAEEEATDKPEPDKPEKTGPDTGALFDSLLKQVRQLKGAKVSSPPKGQYRKVTIGSNSVAYISNPTSKGIRVEFGATLDDVPKAIRGDFKAGPRSESWALVTFVREEGDIERVLQAIGIAAEKAEARKAERKAAQKAAAGEKAAAGK